MLRLSPRRILWSCSLTGVLLLGGCTRDWKSRPVSMWNESRYKPYEEEEFFHEGSSSRPLVPGTIARGQLRSNDALYTALSNGKLVDKFPYPITRQVLARGQERFNIYCTPCHGRMGDGKGMVVQRGFTPPPDYTIARLRNVPVGHFYDVMTNGYGAMYSYASRVSPHDRWAIAAYIRVLQHNRPGTPPDVRAVERNNLGGQTARLQP